MSNYCQCGKGKYADADCCTDCWNKNAAYDERNANSKFILKQGAIIQVVITIDK